MVRNNYTPDRGDLVWIDFNPQKGHEQMGKRPALILSPREYNEKTGLALLCPITNQAKGYPFEVSVETDDISGVILTDQIKSLDWTARNISFAAICSDLVLIDVVDRLLLLIE